MEQFEKVLIDTFVFDIDGTLVDESLLLSEKNKYALNILNKKGFRIILASGRMLKAVKKFMKEQLGFLSPCISYNGSILWDPSRGILSKTLIEPKIATEVLKFLRKKCIHRQVYVDDILYVEEDNDYVKNYCERSNIDYVVVEDLIELVDKKGGSIKLLAIAYEEELNDIQKEAKNLFGTQLEIFKSFPTYLDFVPKGINKGTGLKKLSEFLDFSLKKTMAFGDNENDFEMLNEVGHPIAIGNASERLVKISKIHEENINEGVYNVIKKTLPELLD
ncbi:MAG: hypothetical protein PWQ20_580 [Thermotogaceae bacterium]|jgi:hypothetical protein|nr:hypothetical protein [Thermotogaceae bacterium]MDN5337510.1 hypothetical protein [Thermotogaceae bacterium]